MPLLSFEEGVEGEGGEKKLRRRKFAIKRLFINVSGRTLFYFETHEGVCYADTAIAVECIQFCLNQ